MNKKNEVASGTKSELYDLAGDLHFLVNREHQIIGGELEQMRDLVADAIRTLVRSFNSLNNAMVDQAALVEKIVASNTSAATNLNEAYQKEFINLSKDMKQNIAHTIRSFQFEDIVQQLVMHCRSRAENMEQLFVRLDKSLEKLKNAEGETAARIVQEMRKDVNSVRKILEKENPVKQNSMNAGGIELF